MKVWMEQGNPGDANGGVNRVVQAQYQLLGQHGIEIVDNPDKADVTAGHIISNRPVDVLHLHGVYWSDLPHAPYSQWHHRVNREIAKRMRSARAITVPSPWVAEFIKRDMRILPWVIPHGIDLDEWKPGDNIGYLLWNKNRADDVCSPAPLAALIEAGFNVVTTFAPQGYAEHPRCMVVGVQPFHQMKHIIQNATLYVATTCETFGIGTLEALASGVPVVGYAWGGNADIVDARCGALVEPGDDKALALAAGHLFENRSSYRKGALERASHYGWETPMAQYAGLYRHVAEMKAKERHRVCVVVTSYNYGNLLLGAVESLERQTRQPDEIIVVNDGSTDNTTNVAEALEIRGRVRYVEQKNQGVAAARNNGIAATEAEYVVCLDADDQLGDRYIELCARALEADRALGIAYTGLGILNANNGVAPQGFPPEFDWEIQSQPGVPPRTTIPTAAMFRRDLWRRSGGYKQLFAPGEDAEFYTRILSLGAEARRVASEAHILYRNHAQGASKRLQYSDISWAHPWMNDKRYPFAAPHRLSEPWVSSYHQPAITVGIPVGPGHAQHVSAGIDSLLAQDFRGWEVILYNDTGSDEETKQLIEALEPYPFARLIQAPLVSRATMGPGRGRNVCAKHARAPLLLWLDADDWLAAPDALSAMLRKYLETGSYVYTDWIAWDGKVFKEGVANEYSAKAWLEKGQHAVTALVPKEWHDGIGGFDEAIQGWEDWDYFIRMALAGYCGVRQPGFYLGYRVYSGNRRDASLLQRDDLLGMLRERYEGRELMGCGCSKTAAALRRSERELLLGNTPQETQLQPGQVLMEYTGNAAGRQSVRSRFVRDDTGRNVRYNYGGSDRFLAVWQQDVQFLEGLGTFRKAPGLNVVSQPEPEDDPVYGIEQEPVAPPASDFTAPANLPVADDEPVEPANMDGFDFAAIQRKADEEAETRAKQAQQTQARNKPRKPRGSS
jgi:glycosyltransferase involved in cell wall biosynthesis